MWEQMPVAGSQVSVVQTLLSLQFLGVKLHTPAVATQVSVVQELLSLQEGLQTIVKGHPYIGLHVLGGSQASQQKIGVYTHPVAGLQVSLVQALLSLQFKGVWMHCPVA